jgi:hypothetical protein
MFYNASFLKYNLQRNIKCHCVWHSYNGRMENLQTRYWCVSEGTCGRISRQLGRREYVGNKHPIPSVGEKLHSRGQTAGSMSPRET